MIIIVILIFATSIALFCVAQICIPPSYFTEDAYRRAVDGMVEDVIEKLRSARGSYRGQNDTQ